MARVLLNVPKTLRRGEPVPVRILISHPMESGQRRDEAGRPIPRQVIHSFACTYNGAEVVRLELHPAIAANPYFAFTALADQSGTIALTWTDDAGETGMASAAIEVT